MDDIVYGLFIAFASFTTGVGAMVAVMYYKAIRAMQKSPTLFPDHIRRHAWLLVTKVGVVLTQGLLLVRVIQVGSAEASTLAWFYLGGLCLTGVGIMGQFSTLVRDVPRLEQPRPLDMNESI